MNFKELGDTGIRLPEIGFGTWRYTAGPALLRRAIELGATFIDTAEAYGTESIVGEAIQGLRDRVFVATKASPRNFRPNDLLRAADRSLQRLRTSHIDLYQLHWPNYTVPIEETMAAMEELAWTGKVRFIGVSNFSAAELRKAQTALSRNRIVSNQVRYNLVDRTIERELLRYCQQNRVTVIAHSPLAEGLPCIEARDKNGVLGNVAAATGKSEAQVALNWCISKLNVIAIPKASTVEHVQEDCGASGWQLSSEQLRLLDQGIGFARRGRVEALARRTARRVLQRFGRQLGSGEQV
jgi:diketogulonate reductase-like aldo/keto reductase